MEGLQDVETGIEGLDYVLNGGFPQNRIVLVWGDPGSGKSTLALQFLLEGVRKRERTLYVPMLQSRAELSDVLASHGWSADGVTIVEQPESIRVGAVADQTLFDPSDIELPEITDSVIKAIRAHRPQRMVLDSISELFILAENSYQFYRQILKIKEELLRHDCTALFLSGDANSNNAGIQTLVHGVIHLTQAPRRFGPPHRWAEISKMRARSYRGGHHDFVIKRGGIQFHAGLYIEGHTPSAAPRAIVQSGNAALDQLLGGGVEEGTACAFIGPSGAGKSTLASLYIQAAADRGTRGVVFCFDERREIFLRRSSSLEMRIAQQVEQGVIELKEINAGELFAGEFMSLIRQKVEREQVRLVVIDSLTGYFAATPDPPIEQARQLRQLLAYLGHKGVLTMIVVTTSGTTGDMRQNFDISYIADTVIMVRHFEAGGAVRKCLSVLKKRHGTHESTIREVQFGRGGMKIGSTLTSFSGVLSGQPIYAGRVEGLISTPPNALHTQPE